MSTTAIGSDVNFWHNLDGSKKSFLARKHKREREQRTELVANCDYDEPNEETLQAVKEAEEAERTHFANVKLYSNPRDILEDLFGSK